MRLQEVDGYYKVSIPKALANSLRWKKGLDIDMQIKVIDKKVGIFLSEK